jgi:hypothetical protein
MSTKTTFKRIALVTVAALGFGMLSTVVAQADTASGFTLNTSSQTVVGGANAGTSDTPTALIRINLSALAGGGLTAGETITAEITGVPTSVETKTLATHGAWGQDLKILETTQAAADSATDWTNFATKSTGLTDAAATDGKVGPENIDYQGMDGTDTTTVLTTSYYVAISPVLSRNVIDYGVYTITFTLTRNGNLVGTVKTLTLDFVSTNMKSGAVLSAISTKGQFTLSETVTYTAAKYASVALSNRSAGVIRTSSGAAPQLSIELLSSATGTPVLNTGSTTTSGVLGAGASDDGTGSDFGGLTGGTKLNGVANNGTYGINWGAYMALTSTTTLKVYFGAASASAALTIYAAGTGTTGASSATATGTGLIAGTSGAWTAPLTTKTVVVTALLQSAADTPVADYPLTFTTTWTAAAGDVTPVSGSTGASVVKTDAAGKASITLTYSTPLDGKSATVAITGGGATFTSQVITWVKSKPSSFIVDTTYRSSALKGANKITYTLVDAYGLPVAGEVVTFGLSGANNALGTVTIPSATTDANGQVSYTVTDAAALTTESDVLTATSTTVTSVTKAVTIYYLTTAPVIAAMTGYYALDEYATFSGTLVPSTVISSAAPLDINQAQDLTASFTKTAAVESQLAIRYSTFTDAAKTLTAKGVPVTVTASAGGWILDDAGKPQTSRVIYTGSTGLVLAKVTATTPGEKTFTFTAGTVTGSAVVEFENALGDTRNVTVTAGANNAKATANAAALPSFTAVVTDKLGNPVSGAVISVVATGVGRLATGGKSVQWTTDSSGSYTFELTSTEAGTASVAVSVSTGATANQTADKAGYVGTTVIGDATAGNSTATSTVTFAEGTNAAEANAQAASDAAAEATDAANAATDAANAAAEAADAATAAAQDAADAVAALSAQVATLISGLKSQLTALTNLVIKIQKKVKA